MTEFSTRTSYKIYNFLSYFFPILLENKNWKQNQLDFR